MTQASQSAERDLVAANLRRLMARFGLSLAGLVQATGLDERTIRSVLHGRGRPHARTLHKLATGLGVDADELFEDVRAAESAAAAAFDREANPAVAELIDQQPELFAHWPPHEFDELSSRVAVGGQLTPAGALAAAQAMNRRRELLAQVALILETSEAERLEEYVALLYRRATTIDGEGSLRQAAIDGQDSLAFSKDVVYDAAPPQADANAGTAMVRSLPLRYR